MHEVLLMLEDTEDNDIESANTAILPPEVRADSDGDSDDEMVASKNPNSLSRNQLLAEACVQIRRRDGGTTTSLDLHNVESSNEENAADKPVTQPLAKKAKYTQKAEEVEQAKISTQKSQPKVQLAEYRPNWVKKDFNVAHGEEKFPWRAVSRDPTDLSPVLLFESIFTPSLMELICRESNEYANQKGHENFNLDVPKLKLFIATLLLSGYVPLPRHPMYWEAIGDVHNAMVSGAMSRNRFSAIHEQYSLCKQQVTGFQRKVCKSASNARSCEFCLSGQLSARAGSQCR